ncbi:hypothetical protein FHS31_002792 [Sphingomonas vulcanisoli]|uniref:DUF3140 domain-containing protein n=1 Tax=Sphingomonas vulcanisoli TaxID=1658060 RepID=A0ABX0TZI8_9SPHN|nr:DUF3140 domain-containing protein [Sphingomonas vulcanisoli]NIJ09160.1 hypothetical protein [Sphingomonas vulcanisoli]
MTEADKKKIRANFTKAVNMTPAELAEWLETDESKKVGFKGKDGTAEESIGHKSGRRIIQIKHKKQADLTDDDYAHMRKVVGYVARHSAQKPENQVTSRWRYSLMNWGHDPLK